MAKVGDAEYPGWSTAASGLAAVWAEENTREALFDAMKRKETYATTGSRMLVRFFGGWEFEEADAQSRLPADIGYQKWVPMGGDLIGKADGRSPSFLVAAMKDAIGANLDRIQIVKGWLDRKGEPHEHVVDVCWGDAHRRQPGRDGRLPPVGDTVDLDTARRAARLTGLQLLAAARAELGSLDRIHRVVKVFGMVNCAVGFNRTPAVIDGCSELFHEVFGEAGVHTRSAVGMAELPFDISTEIEAVFELADE